MQSMVRTEIRVKGTMNPGWSDWFQELRFQAGKDDETILYGDLQEIAAVDGVISRLGSLVIELIPVNCKEDPVNELPMKFAPLTR
jgi:hypothetical protein